MGQALRAIHKKVILSLCERNDKCKTTQLSFSSLNTLSPERLYSVKPSTIKIAFVQALAQRGTMEDVFERVFFLKVKSGWRDSIFFIDGALIQHARHEKSQSTVTFVKEQCWTKPPSILIMLPLARMGCTEGHKILKQFTWHSCVIKRTSDDFKLFTFFLSKTVKYWSQNNIIGVHK